VVTKYVLTRYCFSPVGIRDYVPASQTIGSQAGHEVRPSPQEDGAEQAAGQRDEEHCSQDPEQVALLLEIKFFEQEIAEVAESIRTPRVLCVLLFNSFRIPKSEFRIRITLRC